MGGRVEATKDGGDLSHEGKTQVNAAPIISAYYNRIRPLLDAVDQLRQLKVTQEGIQLPTIVVVGDQSSGKSSVLESLAGISLPRGQGICTRVPLIMSLKNHHNHTPEIHLEYQGKTVATDESHVAEAINLATDEVAGTGMGITNTPLTLSVKKMGVPDLTMVDLPGITRVPVNGQPEDIYEQISGIITEYITPEESIILNVLSATVDFATCESIRMSQRVDRTGQRTLAVVTKADKAPEGLLEKVTADHVNIGLGYVCVRNRIGDESYQAARAEEALLFEKHPLLSKIDKSMVTTHVLAQRLVLIQASIISKCLPSIVSKIDEKLNASVSELVKMPKVLTSLEAVGAFMQVMGLSKDSLRKILLSGEHYEYPDDEKMHCSARLHKMVNQFHQDLGKSPEVLASDFLLEEIKVLQETNDVGLPGFLPKSAFQLLLQKKVNGTSDCAVSFVSRVWSYIEFVVISVLMRHSETYPRLSSSMRRAAHELVGKRKVKSMERVAEIVEMEKITEFTCDPDYLASWKNLMKSHQLFVKVMREYQSNEFNIPGFGAVAVKHLRGHPSSTRDEVFDLNMRITAYWKIVNKRLVDCVVLQLMFEINNLVDREMEVEILKELLGTEEGGVSRILRLLEESPSVAAKRDRLKKNIDLLRDSKEVVAKITDLISDGY